MINEFLGCVIYCRNQIEKSDRCEFEWDSKIWCQLDSLLQKANLIMKETCDS